MCTICYRTYRRRENSDLRSRLPKAGAPAGAGLPANGFEGCPPAFGTAPFPRAFGLLPAAGDWPDHEVLLPAGNKPCPGRGDAPNEDGSHAAGFAGKVVPAASFVLPPVLAVFAGKPVPTGTPAPGIGGGNSSDGPASDKHHLVEGSSVRSKLLTASRYRMHTRSSIPLIETSFAWGGLARERADRTIPTVLDMPSGPH